MIRGQPLRKWVAKLGQYRCQCSIADPLHVLPIGANIDGREGAHHTAEGKPALQVQLLPFTSTSMADFLEWLAEAKSVRVPKTRQKRSTKSAGK